MKKDHKHNFETRPYKVLTLWGEFVTARDCRAFITCGITLIEYPAMLKNEKDYGINKKTLL